MWPVTPHRALGPSAPHPAEAVRAAAPGRREPLWHAIRDHLLERIRNGDFDDGFPGENELTEQYGVSRSTIRSALAPLRREGLVTARRGRPSAVIDAGGEHRFGPVYSLFAAVERAGMAQRSEVTLAERRTDAAIAARLGLAADEVLVHLRRIRYADEQPLALDEVHLPADLAAPVLDADLTDTALYQVLRDECGLTLSGGSETLHAVATDPAQSRRLACPPATPAFFIERLGTWGKRPVEWRETLIRGDRFTVTTTYSPDAEDTSPSTPTGP